MFCSLGKSEQLYSLVGRSPFDQEIQQGLKREQLVRNILEKFPENPKLVQFLILNGQYSTKNSGDYERKMKWKGNSRQRVFENLGSPTSRICGGELNFIFQNFWEKGKGIIGIAQFSKISYSVMYPHGISSIICKFSNSSTFRETLRTTLVLFENSGNFG